MSQLARIVQITYFLYHYGINFKLAMYIFLKKYTYSAKLVKLIVVNLTTEFKNKIGKLY